MILPHAPLRFLVGLAFLCGISICESAQDPGQMSVPASEPAAPHSSDTIIAVPNRPTFSSTAETVQTGVFEIEYGFEAGDLHQNINGLLKFGLVKNLELRLANNPLERDAGTAAFGDSAAGLKYRFIRERGALPTVSALYTVILPTAGAGVGVGSPIYALGLLVSKDFGRHHLDFNESVEWREHPDARGFDRDYFTALAYSHPLSNRVGIDAEVAGFSRVDTETPWTLTILGALTYNVSSRLVLDGGCYVAAHGDLPRVTCFAGATYAVLNIYKYLHLAHH